MLRNAVRWSEVKSNKYHDEAMRTPSTHTIEVIREYYDKNYIPGSDSDILVGYTEFEACFLQSGNILR